jgi:hypothetical protein
MRLKKYIKRSPFHFVIYLPKMNSIEERMSPDLLSLVVELSGYLLENNEHII